MDDGPDTGRNRYPDFADTFIFDLRTTSKRNLQLALWQRLESRRKALYVSYEVESETTNEECEAELRRLDCRY
jgi:hypothetical protein